MLELMKKYLMTLLTLGLACNAAACMEDEPFYDTEIPPHASIDQSTIRWRMDVGTSR